MALADSSSQLDTVPTALVRELLLEDRRSKCPNVSRWTGNGWSSELLGCICPSASPHVVSAQIIACSWLYCACCPRYHQQLTSPQPPFPKLYCPDSAPTVTTLHSTKMHGTKSQKATYNSTLLWLLTDSKPMLPEDLRLLLRDHLRSLPAPEQSRASACTDHFAAGGVRGVFIVQCQSVHVDLATSENHL